MNQEKTAIEKLDETFTTFFSDPETAKCRQCGGTDGLTIHYYDSDNGKPVYECSTCKAVRQEEQEETDQEHRRFMDAVLSME